MRKEKSLIIQLSIILMVLIFSVNINSQTPVKKIATIEIENILDNNGIDSAMAFFSQWHHIPIYKIDPVLYLKMINPIDSYSSKYSYIIFDGANNIHNQFLAEKTFKLFKEHTSTLKNTAINSKYKKISRIDNTDLSVLVKQKNDSLESFLKSEYDFWKKATEVRKKNESHYNCLVIMLAFKRLNSPCYSGTAENYHRSNVDKWSKDTTLEGHKYIYGYKEYETSMIELKNEYNELSDVSFMEEPALSNIVGEYTNNGKCWNILIHKGKRGILDVGCQYGGLSGHGNRYLIELAGKNQLKVSILSGWIS